MKQNQLIDMTNIEIYELVWQGRIASFPSGFWGNPNREEGKKVAIELLKYLIEEKFKWSHEDIKKNISKCFIRENKLSTPCKLYFGRSAVNYVVATYPGIIEPWEFEFNRVPQGYWRSKNNRIRAIKWLFETKLQWNIEDIKESFNWNILKDNNLLTLHTYYINLYEIVNAVYPNQIKCWELKQAEVSNGL